VRGAFQAHLDDAREIGAAVAICLDNRLVVDLWGGHVDRRRTRPWESDTLVNVYSTTKGVTATCIHRLIDENRLDPDRCIADYWPEFARNGKAAITIRQLLCHQAGLPAISTPLPPSAIFDWQAMTDALADQKPWWPPGTRHGYHARTFGWLLGELVRRVSGKTVGAYFSDEIARPLGLDFHIGLARAQHRRVAPITKVPPSPPGTAPNLGDLFVNQPDTLTAKAFTNPNIYRLGDVANSAEWRSAEIPSSNGHGTARDLARLYGALACGGSVDGIRILSPERIDAMRRDQARGEDAVLLTETRFGLGFMKPVPGAAMGPNDDAFGHPGTGGSVGFADPEARVGFGYVMNKCGASILIDDRPAALIEAFYASLRT
jgi:CubicO group peptidase (beta-lactamase class C family)